MEKTRGVDPTREAAEGVRHTHRPLRPGWPLYKYTEDDEHCMTAMPQAWQHDGGGVRDKGNRYEADQSGAAEDAGPVP